MTAPLLDSKQAGALLGVPASWVLAQARANRIPHVRLGRYVRFEAQSLEDWWRARLQGPVRSSYAEEDLINVGRRRMNGPPRGSQEQNLP